MNERPDFPVEALLGDGIAASTRLADAVAERIGAAILGGTLKPGDPLPAEGRIASAFGVSKPVAREAVRQLAAMGVVQVQHGKVARVQRPDAAPLGRYFRFVACGSPEGLAEAVEMRRILEPPIARLAAARAGPADIERLQAILARLKAALRNVEAWIEADLDFHQGLAEACGNRLLRLQLAGMRPVLREILELFNARERPLSAWQQTYARHARIVAAVEAHDADAAYAAMDHHFEAADAAIKEIFPHAARSAPAARKGPHRERTQRRRARGGKP
jgi:GntR family transcriptional repressor for pyruvate dehydrogenase complex